MNIQIRLTGQTLTAAAPNLAEQSLGKLFCSLEADSEWDELSIRLIFQLKSSGEPITREVQVTDFQSIPVPEACIRAGHLYITAVGIQGDSVRLTTGHMPHGILISPVMALSASEAEQLSPTEYERLLGLLGPLSQLNTGRRDHLVGAINWLKATLGENVLENSAGYINVSDDFDSQQTITHEMDYLRTLGSGKWTIDSSFYSDRYSRYFMDIWNTGAAPWRLERAYHGDTSEFSESLFFGSAILYTVSSIQGDAPVLYLGQNLVIDQGTLPVPDVRGGDEGKIPVAGRGGNYILTAVENAEETAV